MNRKIILASASPRRRDILKEAGYDFIIAPNDVDEENVSGSPSEIVMELSRRKARATLNNLSGLIDSNDKYLIISADTLVFLGDKRLGKPANKDAWREGIKSLAGNVHNVITGVSLIWDDKEYTFYSDTKVYVSDMSEEDIEHFINRNEDMDKAGGYAIQGYFSKYIPGIEGEYNNVVGFPIAAFEKAIKEQNIN